MAATTATTTRAPGCQLAQERRRSARIRDCLGSCGFQPTFKGRIEQCCACLLDIDTAGEDDEFVAILDCCRPQHCFHVACISTWAERENTCPQCKKRFARIAIYSSDAQLLRVARAEDRDQDCDATDAESSDEDEFCRVCGKADNDSALLLCDGQGGRCNAPYHYYCVGLECVPDGDWFCPPCEASRAAPLAVAAATNSNCQKTSVSASASAVVGGTSQALPAMPQHPTTEIQPELPVLPVVKRELPDTLSDTERANQAIADPVVKRELSGSQFQENGAKQSKSLDLPPPGPVLPAFSFSLRLPPVKREVLDFGVGGTRGDDRSDNILPLRDVTPGSESSAASQVRSQPASRLKRELQGFDEDPGSSPKRVKVEPGILADSKTSNYAVAAPTGGDSLGNLCGDIPKWISRQGRVVRVDLGGRGIRDAAAAIFAKVVGGALAKIGAVADSGLTVSVHLAGNQLHRAGMGAILGSISGAGARVARLDLERNRLDSSAAEWLGDWCERQPGGPPNELYVSGNKIEDAGASKLFEILGRETAPTRGGNASANRVAPMWIEASDNRIRDVGALLDRLSIKVPLCLAVDRSVCSKSNCVAVEDAGGGLEIPRLHLFGILEQDSEKVEELKEEPPRLAHAKIEAKLCKPKDVGGSVKREQAQGHASEVKLPQTAKPSTPTKADAAGAEAGDPAERRTSPVPRGRGRGRARGRGRGSAVASAEEVHAGASRSSETQDRHNWAQSLGRKSQEDVPAYEYCLEDDPPPSYGFWDVIPKQKPLTVKELQREAVSFIKRKKTIRNSLPKICDGAVATSPRIDNAYADRVSMIPHVTACRAPIVAEPAPPTSEDVGVELPVENHVEGARGEERIAKSGLISVLQSLIYHRLVRQKRLWRDISDTERSVRRRCLRDQLCRRAQGKYRDIVSETAGSWEQYLRTPNGHKRITAWIDKKANEAALKSRT